MSKNEAIMNAAVEMIQDMTKDMTEVEFKEFEQDFRSLLEKLKIRAEQLRQWNPSIDWRKVYEANGWDMEVYEQITRGETPECIKPFLNPICTNLQEALI